MGLKFKIGLVIAISGALALAFNACSKIESSIVPSLSKTGDVDPPPVVPVVHKYVQDPIPNPESKNLYTKWINFYGEAGTYEVSIAEDIHIKDMANIGMRLHISSLNSPEFRERMRKHGSKLLLDLDHILWGYEMCPVRSEICNLTPEAKNNARGKLRKYLTEIGGDPNVVGFWVMDDYPGAVDRSWLEEARDIIEEFNKTHKLNRKAVCGFSPNLDLDGQAIPVPLEHFANFTPKGCDYIAFYPYARTGLDDVASHRFDWSMTRLMSQTLAHFKTLGWDPEKQPIIGMPQAFSYAPRYVQPSADELALQIASYCKMGAVSILAFIWHIDSPDYPYITPSKDAELRKGFENGLKQCQNIWNKEKMNILSPILSTVLLDE